ncbi:MAG TPA: DNA mismatch repair endonuclease MutL [Oscillospiraceae bacterium]|nr:DNA mismatch repair endonuclease MutL [Oscillospiraceae bacterium]HPF54905.1 DNA mismatch repair endonuclease MutL [Clostridiales bacterium]HPK34964.1 DNA mismatch repair endonuclease MutL [Oscillospiraceae bacterium]HPR75327.1 DNA mismatch repair endonuclease MutL [Oscillospiraceae bacterium]
MAEIRLLDKTVAELVAAGEVVERPASVIKELLENSIDAGAGQVTVEIQNGGMTFMRVTDNGCGIPEKQVPTAFLRHATSKISTADDLTAIGTLGFRGEALASIGAVAKVEMITKTADSELGCRAVMAGGEMVECYSTGCPNGTTILVRDLFYNIPARLKFMKKDVSEGNAVTAVVQRLALSHPETSVRFLRDGKEILFTPGNNKLYSAIYSVMGKEFAADLTRVEYSMNNVSVSGFVTKPYAAQGTRNNQVFFINGRYVRSRTCQVAIEQAFKNTISTGRFPAGVLNVKLPVELVDVNIHPAKTEVRFVNEQPVFDAVYYGIKSVLGGDNIPKFTGESFARISEKPVKTENIKIEVAPPPVISKNHSVEVTKTPVEIRDGIFEEKSQPQRVQPPERIVSSVSAVPPVQEPVREQYLETDNGEETEGLRLLGEVFSCYILTESKDGEKLFLVDKHAAHERILFERLKENFGKTDSQALLIAQPVTMSAEEQNAVLQNAETLRNLGFEIEDFGGSILLRQVPTYIGAADGPELLRELANQLASGGKTAGNSDMLDDLLHTTACKAAIKAGKESAPEELLEIVKTVLTDPRIRYCPHGRPVLIVMTKREFDRRFGRI